MQGTVRFCYEVELAHTISTVGSHCVFLRSCDPYYFGWTVSMHIPAHVYEYTDIPLYARVSLALLYSLFVLMEIESQ